jgi:hypothetical protein
MNTKKSKQKSKSNDNKKYKNIHVKTRKIKINFSSFKKEIAVIFLEMLLMIKLYHWKTSSYATHKATDDLYLKLNTNIDSFIEILLGKDGSRIDLMKEKQIKLIDLTSQEALQREIDQFKTYLVNLNNNKELQQMLNSDLFNIRDTILGDLNQFLYLLTFK